jgi:drug/metabolite transporter (DMT)-like permease
VSARRGALLALASAAAFGAAAPLVKHVAGDLPALAASGLLYLGCGVAVAAAGLVRTARREARLRGGDFGWLAGSIVIGGVISPWLLVLGLSHASATAASLLLNAELVFTVGVAALVFREAVGRRVAAAALLVVAGGAALSFEPAGPTAPAPGLGALFILLSSLGWAIDSNLAQRIAHRDPFAIIRWKGLAAGSASLVIAAGLQLDRPPAGTGAALLGLGAVGYGASTVLYTYAQRTLGTARTAAFFGLAPFIGAALAIVLGEPLTLRVALAAAGMAAAARLLLGERHAHVHRHEPLVHEHRHVHDEHHEHIHRGDEGPEPHAHEHHHTRLEHAHEHAPDIHHRHEHRAGEEGVRPPFA